MTNRRLSGNYFCGNEASAYAKEHGYLDYATLAKAFDVVMANDIIANTASIGYWEQINGFADNEDEYREVFQCFIISGYGAELLQDWTDEIIYYNEVLDLHVWGVTHWGTSWDYVLTDIKLNCGYNC